jgi:hypothetical protein
MLRAGSGSSADLAVEHEIGPKIANARRSPRCTASARRSLSELHRELPRWEDLIREFGPLFQLSNGYCMPG